MRQKVLVVHWKASRERIKPRLSRMEGAGMIPLVRDVRAFARRISKYIANHIRSLMAIAAKGTGFNIFCRVNWHSVPDHLSIYPYARGTPATHLYPPIADDSVSAGNWQPVGHGARHQLMHAPVKINWELCSNLARLPSSFRLLPLPQGDKRNATYPRRC